MSRLAGLRVWVTRPAHQAEAMAAAIEAAGGHVLRQPLLSIEPPADQDAARRALAAMEAADWVIFTSANAVAGAWSLVPRWAPRGHLAAVGAGTAAALRERVREPVTVPENDYSSAGLLALPALREVAGQTVAIVAGEGGLRQLDETLTARHARVARAAVYRRRRLAIPRPRLAALLQESDAIVLTSGESLAHLADITPAALRSCLLGRSLVVPSARVLKQAHDLGFERPPPRVARMRADAVVDALASRVRDNALR